MKSFAVAILFVLLTVSCWGLYGPVLHIGQHDMDNSRLRPLICVGMAYFLIAVVVPILWLKLKGERGSWTAKGTTWSLIAGALGAVGALGIIMAFNFRGSPVYVMPLVFGGAPVMNTFVTMFMTKNFRVNPVFIAGLLLVVCGAAMVLIFKPAPPSKRGMEYAVESLDDGRIIVTISQEREGTPMTETIGPVTPEELRASEDEKMHEAYLGYLRRPLSISETVLVALSILSTVLCWGSYGPTLHKGQHDMQGSRLRPFMCVGISYFAIAVVIPALLLNTQGEPGNWTFAGVSWSMAAGACGAFGALGIILAFTWGGKPIFVMPLVFGGAPVVNSFFTIIRGGLWGELGLLFLTGLLMVVVGAVTVLIFAPRPARKAAAAPAVKPDAAEAEKQPV